MEGPCWLDLVVPQEQRSRVSEGQKHPRASTQVVKDRACCSLSVCWRFLGYFEDDKKLSSEEQGAKSDSPLSPLLHFDATEKCKYWKLLVGTGVGDRLANGSLHTSAIKNICEWIQGKYLTSAASQQRIAAGKLLNGFNNAVLCFFGFYAFNVNCHIKT